MLMRRFDRRVFSAARLKYFLKMLEKYGVCQIYKIPLQIFTIWHKRCIEKG